MCRVRAEVTVVRSSHGSEEVQLKGWMTSNRAYVGSSHTFKVSETRGQAAVQIQTDFQTNKQTNKQECGLKGCMTSYRADVGSSHTCVTFLRPQQYTQTHSQTDRQTHDLKAEWQFSHFFELMSTNTFGHICFTTSL